jgi:hypothetical protein
MKRPIAVYVQDVGRIPVDSEVEAVMREKARFTESLGWSFRFKSGNEWMLIPLQFAVAWVYDERPKVSIVSDESSSRSHPLAAKYVDEFA